MKQLIVGITAGVLLFVVTASAGAHVLTIRGDWKIGSFAVKRDGTLGGAIDAFGAPGGRDREGAICTVRWPQHGLRIVFYNLGGQNPCRRASGFFGQARAKGPHWQTNEGLEIGDRRSRLRDLYPAAALHHAEPGFWPTGWWLVRRWSPFGTGGFYPGLLARMNDRRVAAFHVRYPAGGD